MNDFSHKELSSMTDKALIELIGKFVQWHRLNQNLSQSDVASSAGVSRSTLSLLERGEKVRIDSLIQILRVLDLLYVLEAFQIKEELSPLEYAKLRRKQRKQASPKRVEDKDEDDLGW